MTKLSLEEIHEATGEDLPAQEAPKSRAESATRDVGELDHRMARLADRHRRPDESSAGALSRLMGDNPELYAGHKRQKARLLAKAGVGAHAASGGC